MRERAIVRNRATVVTRGIVDAAISDIKSAQVLVSASRASSKVPKYRDAQPPTVARTEFQASYSLEHRRNTVLRDGHRVCLPHLVITSAGQSTDTRTRTPLTRSVWFRVATSFLPDVRRLATPLTVLLITVTFTAAAAAQQPTPDPSPQAAAATETRSPWLLVPMFSSSPKLGTAVGGLGAFMHVFDPASRVSLFGATYRYTSTDSQIFSAFARASAGADHHRIVLIAVLGVIKNDYEDYLGTGQPLQTDDDLKAAAGRYLFRAAGHWFIGGQGSAANYQVLGATAEDDLVLETLGVRGFSSAGLGAVLMHDSRNNEDMPTTGWFLNINNLAYREALGGAESFDAYRVDLKTFWMHGRAHVLAIRQYNWLTSDAPAAAQGTVILRGYKQGQYLSPYMSSLEVEERLSFNRRWGASLFIGAAGLYGEAPAPLERSIYPTVGAGLQFVIKPQERMTVNLEYAQGIDDNRGVYLKLGYAW
jgi:hypothetical protein